MYSTDPKFLYNNPDWLEEMYWDKQLTISEVAELADCSWNIIRERMKKFSIPTRSGKAAAKLRYIANPELREIMRENSRKQWEDPEYRKIMSVSSRRQMKKRWEDPEFRKMQYELSSARMREQWQDPDYRKKTIAALSGENSILWRGGKSHEPYTEEFNEEFKEFIRSRENRNCFICGKPESKECTKLHIHHINYDKKDTTPETCVAVCVSCHALTGFDREIWEMLITEELIERYNGTSLIL